MMENMDKNTQQYEQVGELVSIFQRGPRWYVHYRLDGKPIRQSLKTSSKKQARAKALAVERDLINGELRRPTLAPVINDVINEYLSHLRAQRRSLRRFRSMSFATSSCLNWRRNGELPESTKLIWHSLTPISWKE
jgi:hypothetical protein